MLPVTRPEAAAVLQRLWGPVDRIGVVLLTRTIHLYQRGLSPWLGRQCRFHPTCSSYAEQALQSHGLLRGLRLGTWRLLRCQPFATGGFDPVPKGATAMVPNHSHSPLCNEPEPHVTH